MNPILKSGLHYFSSNSNKNLLFVRGLKSIAQFKQTPKISHVRNCLLRQERSAVRGTHRYFLHLLNCYNTSSSPGGPISLLLIQQTRPMSKATARDEATLRDLYKPKECKFETPYGHIAGLEWGSPEAPNKILCLHGWLDNAGSFERLVPFILDHEDNASKYHIIAIDQPGVGLSSHLPAGSTYTQFATIVEIRRILLKLGWNKVTLLSHSFGSHLSFLYCCIYADQVESFISIDLAQPITRVVHNWHITLANSIEDTLRCDYHHEDEPTNNILVPVYSEQDAIKRLMDGHSQSLTRESAEVMMKRGAIKQRWGFTFTRDVRLRHLAPELRPNDELMLQYLTEAFKTNLFIIRAADSIFRRPESVRLQYYEIFAKNCPIFRDVVLKGTHHLHMNTPEIVASEIIRFIDDTKLGTSSHVLSKPINKSNL